MPRYRTIACSHCGHMLLKRDSFCDVCGQMTRRERHIWVAKAVQLTVILTVGAFLYARLRGLTL